MRLLQIGIKMMIFFSAISRATLNWRLSGWEKVTQQLVDSKNWITAKNPYSFSPHQLLQKSNNEVEPRDCWCFCFAPCRQEMQMETVAGRTCSFFFGCINSSLCPCDYHNPPVSIGIIARVLTWFRVWTKFFFSQCFSLKQKKKCEASSQSEDNIISKSIKHICHICSCTDCFMLFSTFCKSSPLRFEMFYCFTQVKWKWDV